MIEFNLNGKTVRSNADSETPLLWVIRDEFGLKGTKFGCGIAMCGACSVHLDGNTVRSCSIPISMVNGKDVTSIEGYDDKHGLQSAWVEEQVPQCGYCQSGQIMQAATLLDKNSMPSDEEITAHMSANMCRCMAYSRIQKAIKTAAKKNQRTVSTFKPTTSAEG